MARPKLTTGVKEYPDCDPKSVCEFLKPDGTPDLRRKLPSRIVPRQEAIFREWPFYYEGRACKNGHISPRYTKGWSCVDCLRAQKGQPLIGLNAYAVAPTTLTAQDFNETVKFVPMEVPEKEPDVEEKKFLANYADTREFEKAASRTGAKSGYFRARMSYRRVFRDAVNQLEESLGIVQTKSLTEPFDWTDAIRDTFLRFFIDTGDQLNAMKAVGVTYSVLLDELKTNKKFFADFEDAKEKAAKLIDLTVVSQGLNGNDKLLPRAAQAYFPDLYSEKKQVDKTVTMKLTPEQEDFQINQMMRKLNRYGAEPVIDVKFESVGEVSITAVTEKQSIENRKKPATDVVQYTGNTQGLSETDRIFFGR